MNKAKRLRQLFNEKDVLQIVGVHNGMSARLAEKAGNAV